MKIGFDEVMGLQCKSGFKEKEYEKFFYARASFSDIRNR